MSRPGDTTAIVLAAGRGTRMKSHLPKVLHPVLGVPIGAYPIRAALGAGAERVIAIVGHQAEAVERALAGAVDDARLSFAIQREQLGTGHAVLCGEEAAGDASSVLILNGDVPGLTAGLLQRLAQRFEESGRTLAMVTCEMADPTGYGRIVRDGSGRVSSIVEHRDATDEQLAIAECNIGLYQVNSSLLFATLKQVGSSNAQGEIYLTDVVAAAAAQEAEIKTLIVPEDVEVLGINDRVDLARVESAMRSRTNESLMRDGVTFTHPESTTVEPGTVIGRDTTLRGGVRVGGGSRIGEGCMIDEGAIIQNSAIGDRVHIKPYSVISESAVGDSSQIGPFAHLRPGTQAGEAVKIGNFVETKKAQLAAGVKASHLSYLGDCQLGEGVNVGAGTITCNYDGKNKFRTVLGAGVFVGSDTQLVAPVNVGDGAYIGAGTTVTADVPADALVISRVRQRVIEGWATKKRALDGEKE